MAKLAAHMNSMKSRSIEITKSYREREFHDDIKSLLKDSSLTDDSQVFLFSDT